MSLPDRREIVWGGKWSFRLMASAARNGNCRSARSRVVSPAVLIVCALVSGSCFAQSVDDSRSIAHPNLGMYTGEARQSVTRGLDFLASRQNSDGSMGTGIYARNVAVVGLSGLAFMANGSTPGRGPYGHEVRACLRYILDNTQPNGFISVADAASHGPMYGHGFATLFLAECHGMSTEPEMREKLSRAVKLIIESQNDEGGWRYQPRRHDADVSVTICQVMALRAARNAGFFVPNQTISRCIDYVKRCQNPDGGFMYTSRGGNSEFARSAAGVVALLSAGIYEGPEIERGLAYLPRRSPDPAARFSNHFFYGHYYAVQAMWHAGGRYWENWYPEVRETLVAMQSADGFWSDPISPEYGTAMATIILQMPYNSLPIFQR